MKIYYLFYTSILILINFNTINAQKIFAELKSEFNRASIKMDFDNEIDHQTISSQASYNFSIGLSGQIYKPFFLKATAGTNDMINSIRTEWMFQDSEIALQGWLSLNQSYLEILPEIRFFENDIFFVNAGIGLSQIRSSKFLSGSFRINNEYKEDLPNFEGRYEYFTMNVGCNYFYKRIGMILELGFKHSGFTSRETLSPEIGVNQKHLKIGLSYQLL